MAYPREVRDSSTDVVFGEDAFAKWTI